MTQQTIAVPTGRRKITAPMLRAQMQLPGLYEATTPGKALSAFKRASPVLGIPRRLVDLVDYLVGRTMAAEWQGGRIMAWPSNATLCDALDIGCSQLKMLIRLGQEFGLFQMRDAPNGQRYGHRDGDGRVLEAYGFNLAPLAARRAEFEQIATAHAERRAEGRRLRRQITALRNRILSLCDAAREADAPGDWTRVDSDVRRIAAQRGDSFDPCALSQILAELTLLHEHAGEALSAAVPVDKPAAGQIVKGSEAVETGPMGPENRLPPTPTHTPAISKRNTSAVHTLHPASLAETGGRKARHDSALRGFIVTPAFIVQIAPIFLAWVSTEDPTWRELLGASGLIRSHLGISQHGWAQACAVLGHTEAIALLAAIAARHAAGKVRSPGGLLRKMVELHQQGELRLDRTLFGLADGLKQRRH